MKIGVSGGVGSFSEQAGEDYRARHGIAEAEIIPLVRMDAVLAAVTHDEVDLGIIAVQNSISGIVHAAVYAMSEYVFTTEEFFEIEIDQNLLVVPGTKSSEIAKIVSQKPALDQCRSYLHRVWPDTPVEAYVDTATAAAHLANGELPNDVAVIASKRCADMYGLQLFEGSIQDLKHNFTTFIAVTKRA